MSSAAKTLGQLRHLSLHLLNRTVCSRTRAGFHTTSLKVVLLGNFLTSLHVTFHFLSVKFSNSRETMRRALQLKEALLIPDPLRRGFHSFSELISFAVMAILFKISHTFSPHLS